MKYVNFVKETKTKYFLADSIKVIEGLADTKKAKESPKKYSLYSANACIQHISEITVIAC